MGYFSDIDADKFATGGKVSGPGSDSDTIPAWIDSGYLLPKRMVDASGWDDMLRRLNFTEDGS